MSLRGMTWDHPRAYRPLAAYEAHEARTDGVDIGWDRQSLEDFEARPISDLAREYDLLVIDHPGLGAALAAGALLALPDVVGDSILRLWRDGSVARTWDSYEIGGTSWAVPIDAATQVSLIRPDLIEAASIESVPGSWTEVVAVARRVPTTLCLGGPHAFLGLLAMTTCAGTGSGEELLDPEAGLEAIGVLREIWTHSDQRLGLRNPIDVHEAMASPGGAGFCPLVYGYAAYARPAAGRYPLAWADAPTFEPAGVAGSGQPGSVLGGTGIAVSARSGADLGEVRAWLSGFLDPAVQTELVPAHEGQPASRAAWDSPRLDAEWNGYYSSTRRSLDQAHIRPRLDGWIPLQHEASGLVRDCVIAGQDPARALRLINERYRALARTAAEKENR
jgi:multiple sugar transport system substrate-binding protein